MSNATCKTCPAWSMLPWHMGHDDGECRADLPKAHDGPRFPLMRDDEWCLQHPDRRPHVEAELREAQYLSVDDVLRIVRNWDRAASRAKP